MYITTHELNMGFFLIKNKSHEYSMRIKCLFYYYLFIVSLLYNFFKLIFYIYNHIKNI